MTSERENLSLSDLRKLARVAFDRYVDLLVDDCQDEFVILKDGVILALVDDADNVRQPYVWYPKGHSFAEDFPVHWQPTTDQQVDNLLGDLAAERMKEQMPDPELPVIQPTPARECSMTRLTRELDRLHLTLAIDSYHGGLQPGSHFKIGFALREGGAQLWKAKFHAATLNDAVDRGLRFLFEEHDGNLNEVINLRLLKKLYDVT